MQTGVMLEIVKIKFRVCNETFKFSFALTDALKQLRNLPKEVTKYSEKYPFLPSI